MIVPDLFREAETKLVKGETSLKPESGALEQDSDSGKGTQRSESSVASPISCASKSEMRKLKRKSKSLSSDSSEPLTEDSGVQDNKTAKKHLKLKSAKEEKPQNTKGHANATNVKLVSVKKEVTLKSMVRKDVPSRKKCISNKNYTKSNRLSGSKLKKEVF